MFDFGTFAAILPGVIRRTVWRNFRGLAFLTICFCAGAFSSSRASSIDTLSGWSGAITATFGDDAGENPGGTTFGQTFMLPQNAQLTDVSFAVEGYAPYTAPQACTFEAFIMAWNGSRPTGPVLYQSAPQAMPLDFYPLITFTLPINNLNVAGGAQYVLFLTSNDFLDGIRSDAALATDFNTYPDGMFVMEYPGNSINDLLTQDWTQVSYLDMAFRIDYVPEPGCWPVVGLGLGMWLLRRRVGRQDDGGCRFTTPHP